MRLPNWLEHPTVHSVLTNVGPDNHHRQPTALSAVNTTQVIPPLPGGPGVWDIAIPFDTLAVIFSLRSPHLGEAAGGMSGVTGIATRNSLDAATASLGGEGNLTSTSYSAMYAKAAAALNLSHKIFDSAGADISLTDIYLIATGPSTRVLRTQWTNYSAGNRTLSCYAELGLL